MQRSWKLVFFALFLTRFVSNAEDQVSESRPAPFGDVRNCPTTSPVFPTDPLYRMEVLPGAGFDALRSVDMGQVHAYNYSKCRVSNDGHYLLPDSIFLVPTLESHVQVFAEYIDHWDSYTSTTSYSISAQAGFESIISAKFSTEYLSVKSHMYNEESITTRVQLRNALFTVKLQPDAQLHPAFKSRIFEIAANIQNNNTDFAHYLAELTVRDYGTHYITSMDAGAAISQVDHLLSVVVTDSEFTKVAVTASASANFLGKFSIGAGFKSSVSEKDAQKFVDNRTSSEVYSWGGPPFGPNMTIKDWEDGMPDSLVAIDRSGDPLYYAITPTSLPDLPESTVFEVADMIFRAITRYYKVNSHYGCTDMRSPNFDFQANVEDNSCKLPNTNFTFGGIFQTCEYATTEFEDLCSGGPHPMLQVNPLTGSTSCREPYVQVLLHSGQFSHTVSKLVCQRHCSWWHCHNNCYQQPYTTTVNYRAYWCVAPDGHIEQNSGYIFGGFFTSTVANPFTGTKGCPRYFMPLHFGEDMTICVSDDYELGISYGVPFAGFESCKTGNPLASKDPSLTNSASWPHACPVGFSQHLVAVDGGCEVDVCIQSGSFDQKQPRPPRLPPFRKRKQLNPNTTHTLIVIGNYGELWYKDENGDWVRDTSGDIQNGKEFISKWEPLEPADELQSRSDSSSSSPSSSGSLSNGAVAGISVVSTIAAGTLFVVVALAGYSVKKRRGKIRKKGEETYLSINEESSSNPQESNI